MIKKILLITKWYPVSNYDDQRTKAIKNIYEGLANYGLEVIVLVPRPEFTSVSINTINNIQVISVPELNYANELTVPEYNFYINEKYGSLLNILRLIKYNFIYLIKLTRRHIKKNLRIVRKNGIFPRLYLKKSKAQKDLKLLLSQLGTFDRVVIHGLPGRHINYIDCDKTKVSVCLHNSDIRSSETLSFLSSSLDRLDKVFYRSHSIHSHFIKNGLIPHDREHHIVYSGVNESALLKRDEYRDWYPGDLLKLVCVASLIPRKNVALLLDVLEKFNDVDWTLDVIGTGPELFSLKNKAKQLNIDHRVSFHGRLPHEQVMDSYINYDVFVLISKNETFGMVYTEAMSRGLTIIGSKGEGIDGLITHGINGFLVDPDNSADLLMTLKSFVSMENEKRREMKDKIFETVTNFSHERVVADYFLQLSDSCGVKSEASENILLSNNSIMKH